MKTRCAGRDVGCNGLSKVGMDGIPAKMLEQSGCQCGIVVRIWYDKVSRTRDAKS